MNNKISIVTLAVGAVTVASSLVAGEVTPEEAQTVLRRTGLEKEGD